MTELSNPHKIKIEFHNFPGTNWIGPFQLTVNAVIRANGRFPHVWMRIPWRPGTNDVEFGATMALFTKDPDGTDTEAEDALKGDETVWDDVHRRDENTEPITTVAEVKWKNLKVTKPGRYFFKVTIKERPRRGGTEKTLGEWRGDEFTVSPESP
jgi:hypothetical protein